MILYLIKSSLALLFLFAFYKLFLEREQMHLFKRIYLLSSIIFTALIPFVEIEIASAELLSNAIVPIVENIGTVSETATNTIKNSGPNWWIIALASIYSIGVVIFTFRFILSISGIFAKVKKSLLLKNKIYTTVLIKEKTAPYSFLNFLFLNKHAYQQNTIANEVFLHEEAHITQKHSLDIIVIEILQILFWFNPLLIYIKRAIKLNHEFLADSAVLKETHNTQTYQNLLLQYADGTNPSLFISNINYSLTKKRLQMMSKQTSRLRARLWKFTLIPVGIGLVLLCSTKTLTAKESTILPEIVTNTNDEIQKAEATPEMVAAYNKLAKKYNKQERNNSFLIKSKDVKKLKYIYSRMSIAQRKSAEPFPYFPEPPPAPESIKVVKGKKYTGTLPPPPPPPMAPLDYVIKMAKKDTSFYHNGKKVTSDRAIAILKKQPHLNIHSKNNKVYITDKPVVIEIEKH